jgi:hypothetical protein
MSPTRVFCALVLPLLLAAGLAVPARADGPGPGCGACPGCGCGPGICCPRTTFCRTRPPCIRWKCVSPKPVCDPCSLDHHGYYPTCWHCWPFPPDYGCCRQTPNSVLADQMLAQQLVTSAATPNETLPTPRKMNGTLDLERGTTPWKSG